MSTKTLVEETVMVSTDYKTTIPHAARQVLDVTVGDEIMWEIDENGKVEVKKVQDS